MVGGGQSALESGALLHEGGTDVTRAQRIHWLQGLPPKRCTIDWGSLLRNYFTHPPMLVPPDSASSLPVPTWFGASARTSRQTSDTSHQPAGARWLVDRLRDVPIRLGVSVVSVVPVDERVKVWLSDGSERTWTTSSSVPDTA